MNATWTEQDWHELREERAAIMEYLGGMTRKDAERAAGIEVQIMSLKVTSERARAREMAQGAKKKAMEVEQPKQEQITLPGFEAAFGGG